MTLGESSRDRRPALCACSIDLGELLLQLRLVGGLVVAERLLHLRQQVLVEELRHLGALGVHDAVEAEVQVGLVELEQLLQQGFQLLEFLAHRVSFLVRAAFAAAHTTAQRMVNSGFGFGALGEPLLQRFDQRVPLLHDLVLDLEDLLPLAALLAFQLLHLLLNLVLLVERRGLPRLAAQRLDLLLGVRAAPSRPRAPCRRPTSPASRAPG